MHDLPRGIKISFLKTRHARFHDCGPTKEDGRSEERGAPCRRLMQHSTSLPAVTSNRGGGLLSGGRFSADKGENRTPYSHRGRDTASAGGGMISQARKASGGLSASAKYRGMSELLRPKDNDPRSGSWTRFSYEKGSTFFAMLDADIAFAEACIKSGGAITARNRWKGGPDKAGKWLDSWHSCCMLLGRF